jgi:hypothetical protein
VGAGTVWLLFALLVGEQLVLKYRGQDLGGRLEIFEEPLRELLADRKRRGLNLRLFNDYGVGGELAWRGFKAFADDRPWAAIDDYWKLVRIAEGWEDVLRRWDFGAALIRQDSSLETILKEREGWREVFRGPSIPRVELGRPVEYGLVLLEKP